MILALLVSIAGIGCVTNAPEFEAIARDAQGRVGVCAVGLETDESLELNPTDRYPMQSVYKIAIAMAMLHDVDAGKWKLGDSIAVTREDYVPKSMHSPLRERTKGEPTTVTVRELIKLAVSQSDGTASDVLLRSVGSFDSAMRFLKSIDVHDVMVASTENEMGRDEKAQYRSWATPRGIVELLRAIHEGRGISKSSREFLLHCMTETANDGKRIKARLPEKTVVAHKTGSSRTVDGVTAATNDVGIITLPDGKHLAIAVFVSDSRADDAMRRDVIARVARAAYDHFTEPSR